MPGDGSNRIAGRLIYHDGVPTSRTGSGLGVMIKKTVFCTIITPDYMPFALALHESLGEWHPGARMVALVAGEEGEVKGRGSLPERANFSVLFASDLHGDVKNEAIFRKYYGHDADAFRWASKPGLMRHLLRDQDNENVVFCDPDILFTASCNELLGCLGEFRLALTPHHHWIDPAEDAKRLRVYRTGFFNAGFVAASAEADPILEWWQESCATACDRESHHGLYVDQRYLDVMPFLFDGVKVVHDSRYNVGGWRMDRFLTARPDVWPLPQEHAAAFLHFTSLDERVALPGPAERVLADYSARLQRHGLPYSFLDRLKEKRAAEASECRALARQQSHLLTRLRGLLRLGTRWRHLRGACSLRPAQLD